MMKKVILKIDGMRCGMCEAHVNDAARKSMKDNLIKIKSSHKSGECKSLLKDEANIDSLTDSIKKEGYNVLSIEVIENYTKKGLFW